MTTITRLTAITIMIAAMSSPALAQQVIAPQKFCSSDDRYAQCSDPSGPFGRQGTFKTRELRRELTTPQRIKRENRSGSGLVTISCGRGKITIANSGSAQWSGFCKDFAAIYTWKWANGYRKEGTCHQANKHKCGGAVDFDQSCRSRGNGHCGIPMNFPIAISERLADKWGLWPGSRWGHRDVGHFEIRGGLASNGWKPKMDVAALPPEPAPKRWPLTLASLSKSTPEPHPIPPIDIKVPEPAKPEEIKDDTWKPRPLTIVVYREKLRKLDSPKAELERAAFLFGVPNTMMQVFAYIESSLNPKQRTGSYKGLLQLSDYEFNLYGGGDIYDARDNSLAAAKMLALHTQRFEEITGKKATYQDIYLIHQQGWEGAAEHISRPERIAWRSMCATQDGIEKGEKWCRKAIWRNVLSNLKGKGDFRSVETLTSGAFVAMWTKRVEYLTAKYETKLATVKRRLSGT